VSFLHGRAAPRVALPWIIRLRYAMAIGQIATVVMVDRILRIDLPLAWILVAPCLVILSNLWLSGRGLSTRATAAGEAQRVGESTLIAWVFVLDTLCLTAVLLLTGGPNNPFSLLYLVHITLSATILNRRQTWGLGVLACLCFASLFWRYRPIPALEMHPHGNGLSLHLIGMWAGFAVASLLVAMFSGKISELLREREESLLRMQEELARRDRLASLVTLAAGAAHELNTPLGTIAVVAKELEHYAMRSAQHSAIEADSRLIRTEVDRCREILRRMSVEGAEPTGEAIETIPVGTLLQVLGRNFSPATPFQIDVPDDVADCCLSVPRHAVEQALIALVKNAVEASPSGTPVTVAVWRDAPFICFEVRDSGCGMSQESLRHAGEPFFTTKAPGKGMGLGIFLVRTLADRLGGRLRLDSTPGAGTKALFELPLTAEMHAMKLKTESAA